MRKWLIIFVLLLTLLIGGYMTVIKFIIPATAAAFMPVKWQQIPIGQKRNAVHEYLGIPSVANPNRDQWSQKISSNKRYVLDVCYNSDSLAVRYSAVYEVKVFGIIQRSKISQNP